MWRRISTRIVARTLMPGPPHPGYQISQVIRKRIEEANGWITTVAGMAQTKFRGLARVGWMFQFKAAAYNLIRCLDCWRQHESVR
jgi:hypothetical protein